MLLHLACALSCALTQNDVKAQLLTGYDKNTRPSAALALSAVSAGGNCAERAPAPPENVTTQFYLDSLSVNQKQLTYTLQGYFRAYWRDARLQFNRSCNVEQLTFSDASQLWTPDFYFEQEKAVGLGGAGKGELLRVQPDGSVTWSRQSSVTLACKMYFGNLPFDEHYCKYTLGMYSQTAAEVSLRWVDGKDALANWQAVSTAEWSAAGMRQANDVQTYATGTYTYALAWLHIKRIDQTYVVSYLVIAAFIVLMSYAGFWVSPAAAPGRIALAVISVLVLTNLSASAKAQLPPFAYKTWLTDFLFFSMLFNLLAFFEYAVVNFGMATNLRVVARQKALADKDAARERGQVKEADAGCWRAAMGRVEVWASKLKDLDVTMRWAFLLAYCLLLIIMIARKGTYKEDA